MLNVLITIDTEIWCDGWNDLDAKFPDAFRRYVYGPTRKGQYALPRTLDILNEHGLTAAFFVEPLFAARFGQGPLDELVGLITDAGQEIQLHMHTEWVDEVNDPDLPVVTHKHQFLRMFSREEQTQLIRYGKHRLEKAGVANISAFRAGNFALNADTLYALAANGISIDTSYNPGSTIGVADIAPGRVLHQAKFINGVFEYPVSTYNDGRGRRHLQLTACSFREFEHLLWQALERNWESLVIVSHNFELLSSPNKARQDTFVVRRFHRLCEFLARNKDSFNTTGFHQLEPRACHTNPTPLNSAIWRTGLRITEQVSRRLLAV